MEREPLGFPSSFAPRRYRQRTSRVGTGHRARARNYALNITSVDPPSGSPLVSCDLASHRPKEQSDRTSLTFGFTRFQSSGVACTGARFRGQAGVQCRHPRTRLRRRCARPVLKLLAHESAPPQGAAVRRGAGARSVAPQMSQPRARQECSPVTAGCLGGPRRRRPGTFGFPARSGCGRTAPWRLLSASFGAWARRSACSSGHRPAQLCSRRAR